LATIESKFEFTSGNKTAGLIAFIFFLASSGETEFFVPAASFMEESLSEGRGQSVGQFRIIVKLSNFVYGRETDNYHPPLSAVKLCIYTSAMA
jgi:hypothetical protein